MNNSFSEKAKAILTELLGGNDFKLQESKLAPQMKGTDHPIYGVFLSVCNKKERARIFRCAADTLEDAWSGAYSAAEKYISAHEFDCCWLKADIISNTEKAKFKDVVETASSGFHEFFRRGISFDSDLSTALIEAEINCNRVISYKKKDIELTVVNKYLSKTCGKTLIEFPDEVVLFDCIGYFCGEDGKVLPLHGAGLDVGRRNLGEITKERTLDVIMTSSEYLSMMVHDDGKFDYGFYPIFHKEIPGYNIMRHATSIWSLICAYRLTHDKFTLQQAEKAIAYMVNNTYNKYNLPADKENTVYLAELTKNEIKVGGNGVAVIMLTEYMDVIGEKKLKKLCTEIGNGILELFDNRNGEFFHVLNFPSLSPKDKFRTVYYDGESVFALARLYGLTGEQKWLDAAAKAADRFIREDYTKHADHWVAYAMNELTKYLPKEKYFEFALRNVQVNLKKIYRRKTTYHTYLELLCVSYELYQRIIDEKIKVAYLDEFDAEFFIDTIFRRAEHMLNGYAYPEYVMYFKYPEQALGAFFVRHDGYRIRIDDIQHFCGAYYSFYKNYDRLSELRRSFRNNKN
ncbi:MAG: glycosyl hydrolase family 88 [Oscillospiraceae bacterium]|nr:glycosyl hydrolase family 88 [Oscillospiraceae bacterium]